MTAFVVVDVQNDFLPGGALAIANGDVILPKINELLNLPFDLKIATKDWHPANHGSFAPIHGKRPGEHVILDGIDQILWPIHCVQETFGAEFAPGWNVSKVDKVIFKGTDPLIDSYSTFFDNEHKRSTGLAGYLLEKNIKTIYFAGLATDYCVKYSVLDAIKLGFQVFVIEDACKGVNLLPNDSLEAIEEMRRNGAQILTTEETLRKFSDFRAK